MSLRQPLLSMRPSFVTFALAATLATLVAAGQTEPARQIALQTLLPGPGE